MAPHPTQALGCQSLLKLSALNHQELELWKVLISPSCGRPGWLAVKYKEAPGIALPDTMVITINLISINLLFLCSQCLFFLSVILLKYYGELLSWVSSIELWLSVAIPLSPTHHHCLEILAQIKLIAVRRKTIEIWFDWHYQQYLQTITLEFYSASQKHCTFIT